MLYGNNMGAYIKYCFRCILFRHLFQQVFLVFADIFHRFGQLYGRSNFVNDYWTGRYYVSSIVQDFMPVSSIFAHLISCTESTISARKRGL